MDDTKTNYRLTEEEIIANTFIFMIAGYETSSTALAYATYEPARHSDVLEKLQAEIDQLPLEINDSNDEETKKYPDDDIVAQMPYMNMFLSEILRMYPIANTAIERRVFKDMVVQGIKIDKGNEQMEQTRSFFHEFILLVLHKETFVTLKCLLFF